MSDNNAQEQAAAQANSIAAMVAALNVDYARLGELKDELQNLKDDATEDDVNINVDVVEWMQENGAELAELTEQANGNEDEDSAREAIDNDPLSVEVRSDWHSPGSEDNKPGEFQILLCTGGPAVRIIGELDDYQQPYRARIEYQDWGTPWTEAYGIIDNSVLLQYCAQFYFGE